MSIGVTRPWRGRIGRTASRLRRVCVQVLRGAEAFHGIRADLVDADPGAVADHVVVDRAGVELVVHPVVTGDHVDGGADEIGAPTEEIDADGGEIGDRLFSATSVTRPRSSTLAKDHFGSICASRKTRIEPSSLRCRQSSMKALQSKSTH